MQYAFSTIFSVMKVHNMPNLEVRSTLATCAALFVLFGCGSENEVGEFKNDLYGNEFKIEALQDPKVEGVTCHITYFDRGVLDRAKKGNWFEDPSNTSIACRQTGPIVIAKIDTDKSGEAVFSQRRSAIMKSIIVRRVYDQSSDSLLYISYAREATSGSAKMSLSTVALYGTDVTWTHGRPEE
ncbi:MAG: CreA family protein [Pseudomonadota bacterium]